MKKQLFKIFTAQREHKINELIAEGWRVVHFTSNAGAEESSQYASTWICVLFERVE